ncbi:MAG: ion transporter [Saprospiraceae bacterium]|nr:ion transporter [Saprospiraceae bacterium]
MKRNKLKERIHIVIFGTDTPEGKLFDIILLISILASVVVVILETVPTINEDYHNVFVILEWIFTVIFTIEYALRIYATYRPERYIFSFYGIVDLIAILPTYLSFFIVGSQQLMVIRALRLLRIFRIFKLGNFLSHARHIMTALRHSIPKIAVFLSSIVVLVTIIGAMMHLIEAEVNESFDSIPRSMYWAIVTLTTVGYGDITPVTEVGQFLSAIVMLLGYAIIAVPTGIISSEIIFESNEDEKKVKKANGEDALDIQYTICRFCNEEDHDEDAEYCKTCGAPLHPPEVSD